MDITGNLERIAITLDGRAEITFSTTNDAVQAIEPMRGKELSISLKPYAPRRTLTQNAYMWVLIGDLAKALKLGKDEVYRSFVKDYGVYEVLPLKDEAVKRFINIWESRGLGWVCDTIGPCKTSGYSYVMAYYGTSSYNSKEMSAIIDAVVAECEEQGISTMSVEDIKRLQNDND